MKRCNSVGTEKNPKGTGKTKLIVSSLIANKNSFIKNNSLDLNDYHHNLVKNNPKDVITQIQLAGLKAFLYYFGKHCSWLLEKDVSKMNVTVVHSSNRECERMLGRVKNQLRIQGDTRGEVIECLILLRSYKGEVANLYNILNGHQIAFRTESKIACKAMLSKSEREKISFQLLCAKFRQKFEETQKLIEKRLENNKFNMKFIYFSSL